MRFSALLMSKRLHLAARHHGRAGTTVPENGREGTNGRQRSDVGRAVLYGSRHPPNDSVWETAKRKGFEVVVQDRDLRNKENKIDTGIATNIVADSYELMKPGDEITLVARDTDYVPTVERVRKRGFKFTIVFWDPLLAVRFLRKSGDNVEQLRRELEVEVQANRILWP